MVHMHKHLLLTSIIHSHLRNTICNQLCDTTFCCRHVTTENEDMANKIHSDRFGFRRCQACIIKIAVERKNS
jgi:hypothetical protein